MGHFDLLIRIDHFDLLIRKDHLYQRLVKGLKKLNHDYFCTFIDGKAVSKYHYSGKISSLVNVGYICKYGGKGLLNRTTSMPMSVFHYIYVTVSSDFIEEYLDGIKLLQKNMSTFLRTIFTVASV